MKLIILLFNFVLFFVGISNWTGFISAENSAKSQNEMEKKGKYYDSEIQTAPIRPLSMNELKQLYSKEAKKEKINDANFLNELPQHLKTATNSDINKEKGNPSLLQKGPIQFLTEEEYQKILKDSEKQNNVIQQPSNPYFVSL